MKKRLLTTGTTITLLAALVPANAGDRVTKTTKISPVDHINVFRTPGKTLIRKYDGNLSLQKAVEIALLQNPNVLRSIEDIERTRGLIIEVRAQALPQITLTGNYSQQDRRLLKGGGGGVSPSTTPGPVALTEVLQTQQSAAQSASTPPSASQTTPSSGAQATPAVPGQRSRTVESRRVVVPNADVVEHAQTVQNAQIVQNVAGVPFGAAGAGAGGGALDLASLASLFGPQDNTGNIQNKSWRVAIEAKQVLYAGGQIRAALSIAKLTQDSSYYQLRDIVDQVISTVRQEFYTVLLNRALITVAEEAVRLQEEELRDQRNRFEAGTVPRFNVLRAEVELANV
jgi:outer membrane protein TolC